MSAVELNIEFSSALDANSPSTSPGISDTSFDPAAQYGGELYVTTFGTVSYIIYDTYIIYFKPA